MRAFLWAAVVLTLAACGGSDRQPSPPSHAPTRAAPARAPARPAGPEAIIVRVARTGGLARAYDYDRLDSAIWTSTSRAPVLARVLGFDEDGGAVAAVDIRGALRRIELRTGDITPPPSIKLTALHSADAVAVYGITTAGAVARLTPTDVKPWTLRPPLSAREVAPQPDGSVLVVGDGVDVTTLWRIRPPATSLLDTLVLPRNERLMRATVGDRAYFASDSTLQPVRARDLRPGPVIRFRRRLRAVAPTPSGDRLYVALDSVNALHVIDRYTDQDNGLVPLPGPASELRMDSLGRFLLVRPARNPDSLWVVAVGTDHVTGGVRTSWTPDLPFVGPDGSILVSQRTDVAVLDPQTLRPRRTITGGAHDFWIPLHWDGFRPRSPELDQPVTFPATASDTTDSILAAIRQSQASPPQTPPPPPPPPPRPPAETASAHAPSTPVRSPGFTVQFAALLNADSAQARASRIAAGGQHAHVVAAPRGEATVYLIVMGPFPTREAAQAAGRDSHQPHPWVYEGAP